MATITIGTFTAETTVTDTGPDGLHAAVEEARATVREFVGEAACALAAGSTWVEA